MGDRNLRGRGSLSRPALRLLAIVLRLLGRYLLTGQSLLGRPTDNATFLYAATQDLRGKPYEKLSGPIWHRLARRWVAVGVPLLFAVMSVAARVVSAVKSPDPGWVRVDWLAMACRWWAAAVAGLLIWGTAKFVRYVRTRDQVNEFIYPAWEAACDAMGADRAYRNNHTARRMVELPDDFKPSNGAEVVVHSWATAWFHRWRERRRLARAEAEAAEVSEEPVEPSAELVPVSAETSVDTYKQPPWARLLPRRRTGSHAAGEDLLDDPVRITLIPGKCNTTAEQNRLKQKVGDTLGMPGPQAKWMMTGRSPYVELRPNHPPPPSLTFEQIKRRLDRIDIHHPIIGLSYGDQAEVIDFINDSPHVLISGAPGTGKTNLVKFILSQRMHQGSALVVLDFKTVSHRWAHNLPGCRYASNIEDIHDLLLEVSGEVTRRKNNAIPPGADVDTPLNTFGTLDILVEESNALADQLRDYWTSIRRPGDPVQSPAVRAMKDTVFLGREFSMHVFVVAQRASASVFGKDGGDVRESFQTRLMSQWSIQTWKMLAGGTPFVRCPKGPRGIWARVQDGQAAIVRVPKISDREAQDWAMSGVPSPGQAIGDVVIEGETVTEVTPTEPINAELVTLRDAAEGNMLPGPSISYDAIRKASTRERDRRFPEPAGMLGVAGAYRLADLVEWKNARDGIRPPLALVDSDARRGVVYQFNTLDPDQPTPEIEVGYIGQTRQRLSKREDQHRGDKPWADLIVGSPIIIWESDACTDPELDDAEMEAIRRLKPRYNYIGQEGAPHAMPLPEQERQRQARNRDRGLPPWEPENRYEMSQMAQLSHAGTG